MPRYEVRLYDALEQIKVAVELTAADWPAAEHAAKLYLGAEAPLRILTLGLVVGTVRELR